MNIKRFFGKNSKAALAQVREALGDDAVILSNRAVEGGNEIMAFREDDIDTIPRYNIPDSDVGEDAIEDARSTSLEALFRKRKQSEQAPINIAEAYPASQLEDDYPINIAAQKQSTSVSADASAQIANMMQEIRNMRAVIESQLTEISWAANQHRNPIRSKVLGKLLSAGFSAALSKYLAENLPEKTEENAALKWAQTVLTNNLNTIEKEDELLDQGGVFALIGPTGVGKTTTTAKLAARYVMKHGTEKLGLITTDAYRIGGHEQLRIYGKILGVMVHTVKDEADLQIALKELKNKHTILIDTVGVSQRDRMVSEQIAMLSGASANIKKLLCLNATNTGDTLIDVVQAYKGRNLDGCIMTKTDEAITIGNVLDVIIREKLKLYYVADGQRVPEDINVANKQDIISRAFSLGAAKNSPFQFSNEDLPFVMGQTSGTSSKPTQLELEHA
ncbi:MAG TPA: flagellar biosynthesis protein FlhF [Methylophilus sp.]|nr:flagellar biosynthesis protein FlhF [Methylophilus sp.]HQQ32430.1 flagellar biosynthesis protein FlhF [Methylophilus sp.]